MLLANLIKQETPNGTGRALNLQQCGETLYNLKV